MDVRCRANRACMASLSPAAMRLTRMTSDEVSPAPAAIADTAAAADFGPFNASIMENSPCTHVPTNKAASGGAVPAFFLENGGTSGSVGKLGPVFRGSEIPMAAWAQASWHPATG